MRARLGQNFLKNKEIASRIVESSGVQKGGIVVEVGPGKGMLTDYLLSAGARVIAIEKDRALYDGLIKKYQGRDGVHLVCADVREFDFDSYPDLAGKKYKIVANIPYYLTSFLIRIIMGLHNKPEKIVLMIQKEVGERLVAAPGDMNLLALSVQMFAKTRILFHVGKKEFVPVPKVDSVVVEIVPNHVGASFDEDGFFDMARVVFQNKRKKMINPLSEFLDIDKEPIYDILDSMGIDRDARPQDLSVDQWLNLYSYILEYEKKQK